MIEKIKINFEKIQQALKESNVKELFLFGSLIGQEFNLGDDISFFLVPTEKMSLMDCKSMQEQLERLLGVNIGLYTEASLQGFISDKLLAADKYGEILKKMVTLTQWLKDNEKYPASLEQIFETAQKGELATIEAIKEDLILPNKVLR
jgi:predicted nucleotidyltransferase